MMFELGSSTARASNNALIPGAFVTTWQTTSAGETITIPIRVVLDSSYTVKVKFEITHHGQSVTKF